MAEADWNGHYYESYEWRDLREALRAFCKDTGLETRAINVLINSGLRDHTVSGLRAYILTMPKTYNCGRKTMQALLKAAGIDARVHVNGTFSLSEYLADG